MSNFDVTYRKKPLLWSFQSKHFLSKSIKRILIQYLVVSIQTRFFTIQCVHLCDDILPYLLLLIMPFQKSMNGKMYHRIDVEKIKFIIQMPSKRDKKHIYTVLLYSPLLWPTFCGLTTLAPQHFLYLL